MTHRWLFVFVMTWVWPALAFAQANGDERLPEWRVLFDEFLAWDVFDIPVWRVALFLVLLVVGLFMKNYVVQRLVGTLNRVLEKTSTDLDNALIERARDPLQWLAFIAAAYLALVVLQPPAGMYKAAVLVLQTLGTVIVGWMLYRAVDVVSMALERFTQTTESDVDDHIVPLISRVLRVALIALAIVTIIQQWGYDVTSLIAGLGIGGLALALAAQDTLGNWFGGVMIFTDRPFKMGDWVKSDHFGEGVVEEVGLRSTKIRTFAKTVITVPNKDVATAAVENFSEMTQRRIKAQIGLTYDTTPAQMREVLAGIRKVLGEHPAIDKESFMVNFVGYGDSSLDVLIYAFTTTTVWAEWLDAREDIYLQIMDVVHEAGSGFAFPSTSVYFENPLEMNKAA